MSLEELLRYNLRCVSYFLSAMAHLVIAIGSIGAVPMVHGEKPDKYCALESLIEFTRNEVIVKYKRKTKYAILHFTPRGVYTLIVF
jgi:hypothetical protein